MPSATNGSSKATPRQSPKPEPKLFSVRETPFQGKQKSFEGSYDATSPETAIVIDNGTIRLYIIFVAKLTSPRLGKHQSWVVF